MSGTKHLIFRARRKDNSQWAYGDRVHLIDGTVCLRTWCDQERNNLILIDEDTLGMSTGLNDCVGNVIFEGDILVILDPDSEKIGYNANVRYLVCWDNEFAGFLLHLYEDGELRYMYEELGDTSCSFMEVVGNVHDNKEYLTPGIIPDD